MPQPDRAQIQTKIFDEPDCLSSDKENIPPLELVTPPSLRNLSLKEESNEPEHKATSWEANVVRNLETLPRASSPYPRKTSTLEDLELDMDNNMVDITDFFKRPPNEKRSPRPKQTDLTQGHCPTPQNSPTHVTMNAWQEHLSSLIEPRPGGSSWTREKYPMDGQHVLEGSHPG